MKQRTQHRRHRPGHWWCRSRPVPEVQAELDVIADALRSRSTDPL